MVEGDYGPPMLRTIPDLFNTLRAIFPDWLLIVLALGIAIFAIPRWWHSIRVKQLKADMRKAARSSVGPERDRFIAAALERAGHHPGRLEALFELGWKSQNAKVWKEALHRLERSGAHPSVIERLRTKTMRKEEPIRNPLEAAVKIETLLEHGQPQRAMHLLQHALVQFPEHEELVELQSRHAVHYEALSEEADDEL